MPISALKKKWENQGILKFLPKRRTTLPTFSAEGTWDAGGEFPTAGQTGGLEEKTVHCVCTVYY